MILILILSKMRDLKQLTGLIKDQLDKAHRLRFILASEEKYTEEQIHELHLVSTALHEYVQLAINRIHTCGKKA